MTPSHFGETDRIEAIASLGIGEHTCLPEYNAISRIAQALFGVPYAYVSIVGDTEQRFIGTCGLDIECSARQHSFCTHTILSDDILVVEDATKDERFATSPLVTGAPHIRFYAGAPLILNPGIRLGSLALVDETPRSFVDREREQLRDLARTVVAQLRLSRAEREARENAANFRLLAENSNDMIIRSDLDGTRRYVSPAAERLLGYDPAELIGTLPQNTMHLEDIAAYQAAVDRAVIGRQTQVVAQQRYRRKDGAYVWVEKSFNLTYDDRTGDPDGYVAVVRDISHHKNYQYKLAHLARHDPLTQLPNRLLFRERLEQAIATASLGTGAHTLFCLDLDHFKAVNDTFGHQAGDRLLQIVAQRIRNSVSGEGTVARLGGDEFAILQTGQSGIQGAIYLAQRLILGMCSPLDLDGHEVRIGVSIGITSITDQCRDCDQVYACADQALYRAKAAGRNQYYVADRPPRRVEAARA